MWVVKNSTPEGGTDVMKHKVMTSLILSPFRERAKINVASVELYQPSEEYLEILKNTPPISVDGPFESIVTDSLSKSINLAQPLLDTFDHAFDPYKECILWHGTRNKNIESLITSRPQLNDGAYGRGFYLSTDLGKADQYAARNDESDTYIRLIGYRCIPGVFALNPHLNRSTQYEAATKQKTSFISLDRDGRQNRFIEVIVRKPENLSVFAVVEYDLFQNRVGLPKP